MNVYNTSTDTADVVIPPKTKILYLSDGDSLDRLDPVEQPDTTTATTVELIGSSGGSNAQLTAIADTRLSPEDPNRNYGSTTLFDYRPADGNDEGSRAIFLFDLSSIPSGATITNANFSIYVENNKDWTIDIGRLTQSWVEGTGNGTTGAGADWEDYDTTNSWATSGGDFAATSHSFVLDDVDDSFQGGDVTSLVQDWHSGTFPNHGLILYATTFPSGKDVEIHSRENTNKPVIDIAYELGGGSVIRSK